jgi:pimeloyl-ACP methyl ester carboxylesterase
MWLVSAVVAIGASSSCAAHGPVAANAASPSGEPDVSGELVVLVHGLGRTPLSFAPLEWTLERAGYKVFNWGYSSICCTIAELGGKLRDDLDDVAGDDNLDRIHFVGHSLGNLLIREALGRDPLSRVGRVVMLAPPNQGSHEADRYARWLGWLLKPLPELTTTGAMASPSSVSLGSAVQVGIIAGLYDGKVSVMETHLGGETAHIVVPAAHSFIMLRADVRRFVLAFLRDGRFPPTAEQVH